MTETVSIEELNTFLPLAFLESLSDGEQKLRLQYWKEHFTGKVYSTYSHFVFVNPHLIQGIYLYFQLQHEQLIAWFGALFVFV
ncbi:TPA: hypothetical protein QCR24_005792 [Bacillus cereus]|nr:hypothetical protein [Bacillus cereus]